MSDDLDITVVEAVSDSEVLVVPAQEAPQPVVIEAQEAPMVVIAGNTPAANGISAYQVAINNGFVGTEAEWLAALQGDPGNDGADGSAWYQGSGVPSDTTGVDGDYYFRTATSDIYRKSAGVWGSPIANIKGATGDAGEAGPQGDQGIQGEPGAAGADGKTVLNGSGAPGAGLGVDGDFYIDTTADEIYGPKTGGAWGSGTSLVGATGAQGPQGDQGIQGEQGPAGADGIGTATSVGALVDSLGSKTTPVDADQIGLMDSEAANIWKKLSWANIKATLKTYFDTLYQAAGSYLTSGGALGTPSSGTLMNCTFPTLNQNTSGTAAGLAAQYVDWDATSGGASIKNKPTIPVKANGAEITTGTDDDKFATAKALSDAGIVPGGITVAFVERVNDPDPGSVPPGYAFIRIDQVLLPTIDLVAGSAPDYNSSTVQIQAYLNANVVRLDFVLNDMSYTYATLSGGTWTSNDTDKVTVEDSATAKFNVLAVDPDSDIITVKQTVNSFESVPSNQVFAVNLRTPFTPNITSGAGGSGAYWSGLRFSLAEGTIIRGIETFISKVTDGVSYTAMKPLRIRLYSGTATAWVTQIAEIVYTPSANDKSDGFTPTESQFHWRGGLLSTPYVIPETGNYWIVLVPGTGAAGDTDVLYRSSSETGTQDYRVWNGASSVETSFTANKRYPIRYW